MRTLFSKLSLLFVAMSLALTACDKAPVEEQKPVKFEVTSEASVEIEAEVDCFYNLSCNKRFYFVF